MELHPALSASRREFLTRSALLAAVGAAACSGESKPANGAQSAGGSAHDALDQELALLTDQRASVAAIDQTQRRERRQRTGKVLASRGIDALICEAGATMTWLSGYSWGKSERLFALIVLADGSHFWLCPAFEASKARGQLDQPGRAGGEIVSWEEHEYPYKPLVDALRTRKAERLAIDPALRHGFVLGIEKLLGRDKVLDGHGAIIELRAQKEAGELAILRKANELTQLAIKTVARTLRPGMKGSEIGSRMDRAHERLGMSGPWCLPLIGPAAALPHGEDSERVLEAGSVLLVDTGGTLHGYQSDITRTWIFGAAPSGEPEKVWHCVRDAQQRAFETLKPGVPCREIDRAARGLLTERGYGPGYRCFTHRLGHGIGLEGHEDPYFDGSNEVLLAPGMTFSDEPGVYLPGQFGVRIEDIVCVTADGGEVFGRWQSSPASPE